MVASIIADTVTWQFSLGCKKDAQPEPVLVNDMQSAYQPQFARQRQHIVSFMNVLQTLACHMTSDEDSRQSMSGTQSVLRLWLHSIPQGQLLKAEAPKL